MKVLKHRDTQEIKFIESTVNLDLYVWEQQVEDSEGNVSTVFSEYYLDDIELEGGDLDQFLDQFIRPVRNTLLRNSDLEWIRLSSQLQDLTEINAYKQELRDFPENIDLSGIDYIDEIEWPTKPF